MRMLLENFSTFRFTRKNKKTLEGSFGVSAECHSIPMASQHGYDLLENPWKIMGIWWFPTCSFKWWYWGYGHNNNSWEIPNIIIPIFHGFLSQIMPTIWYGLMTINWVSIAHPSRYRWYSHVCCVSFNRTHRRWEAASKAKLWSRRSGGSQER